MFQYLRKAVTGSQVQSTHGNLVRDVYRKLNIKNFLASSIKQLQRLHIDNPDGIIERNDEAAENICIGLEAVFLHELIDQGNYLSPGVNLKSMFSDGINRLESDDVTTVSFWGVVKEVTHSDVITQLKHLVVTTSVGLSRAWIRLAMNDSLIISYLDAILADKSHLRKFYSPNAFLMDPELPDILKELLQGLLQFHFRLNYNSSKLNSWDVISLQLAGIVECDNPHEVASVYENQPVSETTKRVRDLVKTKVEASNEEEENSNKVILSPPQSITTSSSSRTAHSAAATEKTAISFGSSAQSISSASEASPQMRSCPSSYNEEHSQTTSAVKQTPPVGNRLGGDGWSGWSSSFENTPASPETDPANPISPIVEERSFNSILETYGYKSNDEPDITSSDIDTVDGVGRNLMQSERTESFSESNLNSPTYNDSSLKQMNFEIVPRDVSSQIIDEKTQTSFEQLSNIAWEVGLDKQSFRCYQCSKPIGLIYGPYRICHFNGGYYCSDCHDDEEHIIPAQVLHNWHFQKFKVSKYNKLFLMKIEEEPLFHVDEINPTLYEVIPILREVKLLRVQLQYIKEYVVTCRQEIADDFRMRLWPREYLSDDMHQFSLLDLVQVQKGQLSHHLQKIISQFIKHIYKCNLCREKGFICEFCNDGKIIYPFELSTATQCRSCLSVFHKKCRKDKRCPKCVRIQLRLQNTSKELDMRLSVTQKEQLISSDIL